MTEQPITKDVNPAMTSIVQQARDESFQSRSNQEAYGGLSVLWWGTRAGLSISPWWSPQRDVDLRNFWKKPDHLAGAVYALESKMTAIPFTIVPIDQSNKDHVVQAQLLTQKLMSGSEFGEGWVSFYGKWIEDLMTSDNGAFGEIIGAGNPSGPIVGEPLTVAHLDSSRCIRTGNPEFPVIYRDTDGKMYKLHYTRVLYASQMTSPIAEMFGVGFCAVSRCVNVAQTLLDILVYKQEKLGSRPHRSIIVTQGGLDPNDVRAAFEVADSEMDSQRLSRYSKTVLVGSASITEADMKEITLANMPDGFNEETSITLGMATIALAFGVDARELFPAMSAGATRADALLQHLKQRGKGPGQIIQITETRFNHKFLPPHLKMVFDFQDDAEDRQVAEINQIRSNARNVDLLSGALTDRTAREIMLQKGEIDRGQFEELELKDGRLEDGTDVTALFFSNDPKYKKYLSMGVDDPTDVFANEMEQMLAKIRKNKVIVMTDLINTDNFVQKGYLNRALSALTKLEEMYTPTLVDPNSPQTPKKGVRNADQRLRTIDLTNPTAKRDMSPAGQLRNEKIQASADDKQP